jgi:hypothetical protein
MVNVLRVLFICSLLTIISCNDQANKSPIETQTTIPSTCIPYFEYDQLDHYYISIDHDKLWDMENKKTRTPQEEQQIELLLQQTPDKLSDSFVLNDLEKLDFIKKEISPAMFGENSKIFCERKHKDVFALSCVVEYRDILIFKKKNKITGIAKICFGCNQKVITGATSNTSEFGQSGDYEKLNNLLHSHL